jgi:hypothetical protein
LGLDFEGLSSEAIEKVKAENEKTKQETSKTLGGADQT